MESLPIDVICHIVGLLEPHDIFRVVRLTSKPNDTGLNNDRTMAYVWNTYKSQRDPTDLLPSAFIGPEGQQPSILLLSQHVPLRWLAVSQEQEGGPMDDSPGFLGGKLWWHQLEEDANFTLTTHEISVAPQHLVRLKLRNQ
jgi:hypothetical protein